MSKYWNDRSEYQQPDASSMKRKAKDTSQREKAKGKHMEPVIVYGRKPVKSWWGQAWCDNLEQYADFESRLERGKSYVRNNTVVDLKISRGKVMAKVQGRRKTPYKVTIRISPLSEEQCQQMIEKCSDRIENMESLLSGNLPEELQELFRGKGGLFPEPKEISFDCSCPDWALMCKHVAACLYGIGIRFDEDPLLFFSLRGIDVDRFVTVTLESRVEKMVNHAGVKSDRIIEDADLTKLFGISEKGL